MDQLMNLKKQDLGMIIILKTNKIKRYKKVQIKIYTNNITNYKKM